MDFNSDNVNIYLIGAEYFQLQNKKIELYKKITEGFSIKHSLIDFYNVFDEERKLLDKKLRKLISKINISEVLDKKYNDFDGKDDMIYFFNILNKNLNPILKDYDIFLQNFRNKFLTDSVLELSEHFTKEKLTKIRNEIKVELDFLKENIAINFPNVEFINKLKVITSKEYLDNLIKTNLEKFCIKFNAYMKKVNMLGVAITPSIIYSNISLVFVSKGLEMSEIENPWLISFISFFSLSLIFYSTSFINLYKKDVNKYKDNINLYIQDCVNFFLTMAPLGQGVGGPAYTAYVFFFESLGVNQTLNLMISNTLRSFLLVPIVIPFFLFTDKIKSKFNKLKK